MKINEASLGAEQKKLIASKLKPVLAKYGVKGKLSVRGTTVSFNITECSTDLIGNAANVMALTAIYEPHYYVDVKNLLKFKRVQVNDRQIINQFSGKARTIMVAISNVLNIKNYTKSDWTNDWVEYGYHVDITIGSYEVPFVCTGTPEKPNDKLKTILGDQTVKESKLTEDIDDKTIQELQTKCKSVEQKYGVKIRVIPPNETQGKNTVSINIESGKIDFISDFVATATETKVASTDIIDIAKSKEWVTVHNKNFPKQFSGAALNCVSDIMKFGKQLIVAPNQLKVYIGGRMKRYAYLGPKKKITEDAKQLIQNPILKVFDQFGKQYLAQVLDASLNKMIQAAARRGAKVTVPQLIAEIQQNPKGQTAQVLFKAMATVIKQVSAQIPTIVSTNVSSISESLVFENTIDKKTFQTKLESIITPIFEKYGFKKSYGDGWIKEIGKNKTTGRVFLKSYKGTKRRYSVYPDQIETEQFYLEGQHSPTKDVVCMFDLKDTSPSYIQSACKEVSTLMDRYYGVK